MLISRIHAHNIKGAKEIDHNLEGQHLYVIGGKNGEGKSSGGIDALLYALRGGKHLPDKPVRSGESSGVVEVELSGFSHMTHSNGLVITRKFYENGRTELVVRDDADEKASSPAKLLNDLCGETTFDPLHFTKLSPGEQVEFLKGVVGIADEIDSLDAQKRDILDKKKSAEVEAHTIATAVKEAPHHEEVPDEPIVVNDLLDELGRRTQVNQENDRIKGEAAKVEGALADRRSAAKMQETEVQNLIDKLEAAQKSLEAIKEDVAHLEERDRKAKEYVASMEYLDTESVSKEISLAAETNEKISQNASRKALAKKAREAKKVVQDLEKKAADIRSKRKELMAGAKWPVEGLSFDESDGVVFNGIPIEQLSHAEQLDVSVSIGIASAPELKVFTIRDGSLLDNEMLDKIASKVKQAGCQLIVEVVTRSKDDESRCAIVIEDGGRKESSDG